MDPDLPGHILLDFRLVIGPSALSVPLFQQRNGWYLIVGNGYTVEKIGKVRQQ